MDTMNFLHTILHYYVSLLKGTKLLSSTGVLSNEMATNLSSIQKRKQFGPQLFPALHLS